MSDEATADALMGWRLVVGGGLGKQNRGEKREIVKLSNPMLARQQEHSASLMLLAAAAK
jgi:hypothetical protein